MPAALWAWGAGTSGQLGNGFLQDVTQPHSLTFGSSSLQEEAGPSILSCGGSHAVAAINGSCWTWGRDCSGANEADSSACTTDPLGFRIHPEPVPLIVPGLTRITAVACGWEHTLLVSGCGVWASGDNSFGQLGLGSGVPYARQPCRVQMAAGPATGSGQPAAGCSVIGVACGLRHSLLLLRLEAPGTSGSTGSRSCLEAADASSSGANPLLSHTTRVLGFGSNRRSQLCRRPLDEAAPLLAAAAGPGAARDAEPPPAACPRAPGRPSTTHRVFLPVELTSQGKEHQAIKQVVAGGERSGSVTEDGRIFIWGRAFDDATEAGHGPDRQAAATAEAGSGCGHRGAGSRRATPDYDAPQELGRPGAGSALARCAGGWSLVGQGQAEAASLCSAAAPSSARHSVELPGGVGDGTVAPAEGVLLQSPASPAGGSAGRGGGWVQLSLGWQHLLALDTDGHVWSLGSNRHGQLGIGARAANEQRAVGTAVVVDEPCPNGLRRRRLPMTLEDGQSDVCLGTPGLLPTPVCGLPATCGVALVAAGAEHSVAVTRDGQLYAWGWNEHGQLGLGHTSDSPCPSAVPVPVPGLVADGRGGRNVDGAGNALLAGRWSAVACGSGFTVGVAQEA